MNEPVTDQDNIAAAAASLEPELEEALISLSSLAGEDADEALEMFQTLPEEVQALPDFRLALANIYGQKSDDEAVVETLRKVLDNEDDLEDELIADTYHLLADSLENLERLDEATDFFLKTLEVDQQIFEATWDGPNDIVVELRNWLNTISTLPVKEIDVRHSPTSAEVKEGADPRAIIQYVDEGLILFARNLYLDMGEDFDDAEARLEVIEEELEEVESSSAEHLD
ncbi:MAG: hypothetical protein MK135_06240 [Polyangiaceae bacterium]|nr:hypothetical protein [Polyangiaceae bacterium]